MDAYGTNAGFYDYHTARGRDVSDRDDAEITSARLVASEWIDSTFRDRFMGWKVGQAAQVREWPRSGVMDWYGYSVPSDRVPVQIEHATYEAAHRATALNPDSPVQKYKRVSIEGAISVDYADTSGGLQGVFPAIGAALSSLLWGNGDSAASGRTYRA